MFPTKVIQILVNFEIPKSTTRKPSKTWRNFVKKLLFQGKVSDCNDTDRKSSHIQSFPLLTLPT